MTLPSTPHYPLERIELDQPVAIAPGLHWLRTSLPFALDHINIWLLDDGDAWTIIDTGVGDEPTAVLWDRLRAGRLDGKPVARVLVTHFHPDHIGQAGRLCQATGAPLLMSQTEWLTGRALALDDSRDFVEQGRRFDRLCGLAPDLVERRRERGNLYRRAVTMPPPAIEVLRAGQVIGLGESRWTVMVGQGHAPEQVTLYSPERNILIAADQILPKITPVIAVWSSMMEDDPLGDFRRSLHQYRALPEDVLVLHGLPFLGLHQRIDQLEAHHEERLARTFELCAAATTVDHVMRRLFDKRPLELRDIGFAMGETVAHLNRLIRSGHIERTLQLDGAWYFRRL